MRSRGEGKRIGISACLGVFLVFLMVTTPGADYRTLYGDGLWHDMGGGWCYAYNTSLNDCYWRYSGVTRFAYDYDGGQWWDYRSSWGSLGASGISTDDFIGDGTWHSLNNGWTFAYNKSLSDSYFNTGSAMRFSYDYDGGRWWHYRTSWYTLGGTGVSQSFVGDGAWHNLNDGWSYAYNKAINDAYWNTGSAIRFSYDYDGGRWWHYRTSWYTLGASGVSQQFIGDGVFHSLSDGWSYAYNKAINDGYWNTGSAVRFVYDYDGGQWWHYRTSWSTLGASGLSQSFVGDGAWHNLNDGWYFAYNKALNDAYWNTGSATRFSYDYDGGWWWDNTFNGWGRLGAIGGMSNAFIGDGAYHAWTGGDSFIYRTAENTYYWNSGGTDWYRYNFTAQTWEYRGSAGGSSWYSMTYSGSAQNPDCRYLYNGLFVERGLYNDTGLYAPSGRKELRYAVYRPSSSWSTVAKWKIHRAGSDNNWSGGNLNIAWGNTRHWNGSAWVNDFGQRYGEFTAEDVIFFAEDFEENPIGFANMVNWMTYVRDYYGTQIRTVQVAAHGNTTGWSMGQWMSTSNYTSFQSDWVRWGNLMTADGQLVSIHCQVGNAASMLNTIAGWSGMDIFANTNETWTVWWWLNGSGENSANWNYNYNNVTWRDNSQTSISRYFEFTTTGSQNYRWLFQY